MKMKIGLPDPGRVDRSLGARDVILVAPVDGGQPAKEFNLEGLHAAGLPARHDWKIPDPHVSILRARSSRATRCAPSGNSVAGCHPNSRRDFSREYACQTRKNSSQPRSIGGRPNARGYTHSKKPAAATAALMGSLGHRGGTPPATAIARTHSSIAIWR